MEGLNGDEERPAGADVEAVSKCIELMQGAAAKVRLYGDAHPETLRALDELHEFLTDLLDWLGPVALHTGPDGFIWKGTPVSEETDEKQGLARLAHMEGISLVGFAPGITSDELARLLAILRTNLSLPAYEEETMESLLWQAEFQFVVFRAISELMQAEAESGKDDDQGRLHRIARAIVELQPGDLEGGRKLAAGVDDVRGGDIVDQWQLDASLDAEAIPDEEWRERFADESGDDANAVAMIREAVRFERSSQLLARVVTIILRAGSYGRPELPPQQADALGAAAMRHMYGIGDPVGVLEVVEWAHRFSEGFRASHPHLTEWLRDFLRRTYSPVRVARLIRNLDPDEPVERRVAQRFLQILPDSAVVALFDGVARDETPERFQPILRFVCTAIHDRLATWLRDGHRLPTDRILPLVEGLRIADQPEFAAARPELLRHPSSAVRESVLEWYVRALPDAEVQIVAASLVDRSHSVRDAATRVLMTHRPPEAVRMVTRTLRSDAFKELDEPIKTDLCVAFGQIAGPSGTTLLTELLNERTGLLRDADAVATVNAAAMGLAAMGTPNAIRVLEKGARALGGARRSACQLALGIYEQKRLAEANDE